MMGQEGLPVEYDYSELLVMKTELSLNHYYKHCHSGHKLDTLLEMEKV